MRMPKVLLVDANPDSRASVAKALLEAGYDAVVAQSGSSAVDMLEAERPDLVMSCAHVHDMDAHELFTLVRKDPTTMDTPFLLVAGRNRPVALAAAEAGVEVVVTGDINPDALVERVRGVLGREGRPEMPAGFLDRRGIVKSAPSRWALHHRSGGIAADPGATAFQGSFDVMDLTEITQALALGGKTGRLGVALAEGEGLIVFEQGRIVHASFSGKTGTAAFTAIMVAAQRQGDARFRFSRMERGETADGPRTIFGSVEQLLLSIAVEMDESDLGAASIEGASPA